MKYLEAAQSKSIDQYFFFFYNNHNKKMYNSKMKKI